MDRGRITALSCFSVVSGGSILPPRWPDRPAIWGMSGKSISGLGRAAAIALDGYVVEILLHDPVLFVISNANTVSAGRRFARIGIRSHRHMLYPY